MPAGQFLRQCAAIYHPQPRLELMGSYGEDYSHLSEDINLQFRVKAFNVWNHTNWSEIDTTQGDGTAGEVLNAGDKRQLQLVLKLSF